MGQRGRPRHPDILTPREWEVLELLRDGLTNPQIAERLGISLDGAKFHVSEILSKLGLASREQAARFELRPTMPFWRRALAPVVGGKVALLLTSVVLLGALGIIALGVVLSLGGEEKAESPFVIPVPDARTARTEAAGIHLIQADGTGLQALWTEAGIHRLWWSPDGQRLAIIADMCGSPTILVATPGQRAPVQVAQLDGVGGLIKWTPDSRSLLATVSDRSVPPDEHTTDVKAYLIPLDRLGDPELLFHGHEASFSPDGAAVAFFERDPATEYQVGSLKVMDLARREVLTIDPDVVPGDIAWSPDGSRIGYTAAIGLSSHVSVIAVNRDGTGRVVLADGALDVNWLSDGSLVFTRATDGAFMVTSAEVSSGTLTPIGVGLVDDVSSDKHLLSILRSTPTGTEMEVLDDGKSRAVLPGVSHLRFSPNGKHIVFESSTASGLFSAEVDGGNARPLVVPSIAIGQDFAWSPDGQSVAFNDTVITSCG